MMNWDGRGPGQRGRWAVGCGQTPEGSSAAHTAHKTERGKNQYCSSECESGSERETLRPRRKKWRLRGGQASSVQETSGSMNSRHWRVAEVDTHLPLHTLSRCGEQQNGER